MIFFNNASAFLCALPKVSHNRKPKRGCVGLLWSGITRMDVQSFIVGHGQGLGLKVHGLSEHVLI